MAKTAAAKTAARKGQKRRTGKKQAKGGMWPWYLAGMMSIGAAVAYDHRAEIVPMAAPFYTASIAKPRPIEKRTEKPLEKWTEKPAAKVNPQQLKPALAMPTPGMRPVEQAALDLGKRKPAGVYPGKFYFCTDTLENCVVDGGTFWFGRRKIRIADIEAPSIKQAKCDNERKLGSLAKRRLWEILNAGEVRLASADGASGLRVTVGEGAVGDILVAEGLARHRTGGKRNWCAGA